MSEIESYAALSPVKPSQNDLLALQKGHAVLSPDRMLQLFTQMRDNDMLQSPLHDHPEFKGQPWLDVDSNVPYSLRPRIPPPEEAAEEPLAQSPTQHFQQPTLHAAQGMHPAQPARVDSQSRLFDSSIYGRYQQQQGLPGVMAGTQPGGSADQAQNWGYPPGFSPAVSASPVYVPVESIQWIYTDPNGMHQGPFGSSAMNQWFVSGWLQDELAVKRLTDSEFVPIGLLKSRLETDNPFSVQATQEQWDSAFKPQQAPQAPQHPQVPQVPQAAQAPLQHPQVAQLQAGSRSGTPFGWNSSVWGGGLQPSLSQVSLTQSQPSLSQVSLAQSHHMMQPSLSQVSLAQSHQQVHEPHLEDGAEDEHPVSGLLSQLDIQSDDDDAEADEQTSFEKSASPVVPVAQTLPAPIAPIAAPSVPSAAPREPEQHTNKPEPSAEHEAPSTYFEYEQEPLEEYQPETVEQQEEVVPWAAKPKRAVSLAEIQGEAKRKAEQARQQQLQQQQAAQQQHSRASHQVQYTQLPPQLASNGTSGNAWATPVSQAPRRSVAEIQREQALAQKSKAPAAPKPVTAWSGAGLEASRRAPASAQPAATSNASAAASPWQTVNRKLKPAAAPSATPQPAHPAQPPKPVAVRAPQPMKPASRTDELISWCKITFKQSLAKDVNGEDLLSLFLTIPGTADGKEFIADSIYSYSATLDGRRFANEFIQRRKQAESDLKPGETWNDVLSHASPNAEVDPSFQVVTKKQRYRQIARPE